jgi:HdeA/HdeB family
MSASKVTANRTYAPPQKLLKALAGISKSSVALKGEEYHTSLSAGMTREGTAMRSLRTGLFFCSLISLSIASTTHVQAQYAVNMSLVTCTQYLAMPPERARIFSAWMSGWFNQKTGYTYVNLEAYARNVENVKAWCAANPGELVMTGLQRATAQ